MTIRRNIAARVCNRIARAAAAMFLLISSSCQWRPLELPEDLVNVRVRLVTDNIKNVTSNIYNPEFQKIPNTPEVMHALFFDRKTEQYVTESFLSVRTKSQDGAVYIEGDMFVPSGEYKMLIYNMDTEYTFIRDIRDWQNAAAYTRSVSASIAYNYSIGSKTQPTEPIVEQPDHLWVVNNDNEVIPKHAGLHIIEKQAHSVVDTYYLQVKIDGIENISEAQAYITGLAGGRLLGRNMMITNPTNSVHFPLMKSTDKGSAVLCNVFNTFGHIEGNTNKLEIAFSIKTKTGNVLNKTIDITELFRTEAAINNHWLLLDEVIEVKPDSGTPGGMAPVVSDWTDENVNLII